LDFRWSFGDNNGSEIFTDQWNSQTVNANSDQIGPEAAYLYRTTGSYTVRLTATGKDENGDLITAQTTQILTLGTYYVWLGNATGGTFTLTVNGETTSAIPFDADELTLESALHGLASLDATNCRTFRNKGLVHFFGNLAGQPITFTGDFSGLTGISTGTPDVIEQRPSDSYSTVEVLSDSGLTTQYFDSNYTGGNGASDGSITRPYTTHAQFRTFITGGSNRKAVLVDGSDWTQTSKIVINSGIRNIRVARSGGGVKPIIRFTVNAFEIEGTWGKTSIGSYLQGGDYYIGGIDFRSSSNASVLRGYGSDNENLSKPYSSYIGFVLDNCSYASTVTTASSNFITTVNKTSGGVFISATLSWNNAVNMGTAAAQAYFPSAGVGWFFCMGGSVQGGVGDLTKDHHFYISLMHNYGLRWIESNTGTKNYFANCNARSNDRATKYVMIDGCDSKGTLRGFDFSNSSNDPGLSGHFDGVVIQFCKVSNSEHGILCYNLKNITIRNTMFVNTLSQGINSADTVSPTTYSIYNCIFYNAVIRLSENQQAYFHNNVCHTTSATNGSVKICFSIAGPTASSVETWDCDNNVYYAPSATHPFYDLTNVAFITFATWQGYGNDTNGSVADPQFVDPETFSFIADPEVAIEWPGTFTNLEYSVDGGDNWVSYTNEASVVFAAELAQWGEMLFRATTVAEQNTFTITATTTADSPVVAAETDEATLIGLAFLKHLFVTAGVLAYKFSYEG
jgi:hypothetical protein